MDSRPDPLRRHTGLIGAMLCLALAGASGCAPQEETPTGGDTSAARGESVFDYNCGFCHGETGRGPKLSEIRALSQTERRNAIINHPVAGQIPQRLPAHELSDLIEFIESEGNATEP